MRPRHVVLGHPRIDRGLRRRQVTKRHGAVEQLTAQRPVEPLDLPGGGRRPRLGQPVRDAVIPADPVEQHLPALAETISELLAIVRQYLAGHAEPAQRGSERQAHRPARCPDHDLADHAVPRMVIDPGHDLRLGAVGQERPADNVELPQRHRRLPLPPAVGVLGPLPRLRVDQAVPDQHPVHAHPRRHRNHANLGQFVGHPQRTPPRMLPAHLAHHRLDLGAHLVRARLRPLRAVHQPGQARLLITADPGMHALPRHPEPLSRLSDRNPGSNIQDSPVTLLDNRQLNQCQSRPPARMTPANDMRERSRITGTCNASGGTGVSSIYRDRTTGAPHALPNWPVFARHRGGASRAALSLSGPLARARRQARP
jgi:hypothetical protein